MCRGLNQKKIKGDALEKNLSQKYHRSYTPVLISGQVLRSRGAGQIDLCYLDCDSIILVECKHGGILSRRQYDRLKQSGDLIGKILDKAVFVKLVFAK